MTSQLVEQMPRINLSSASPAKGCTGSILKQVRHSAAKKGSSSPGADVEEGHPRSFDETGFYIVGCSLIAASILLGVVWYLNV